MLEKWKSATGNKKSFGALLTDLSKAFVSLSLTRSSDRKIKCMQV